MELSLNHCAAMFPSFSNSEIRSFSELETQEIALSSAKLWRSEFLIYIFICQQTKENRAED